MYRELAPSSALAPLTRCRWRQHTHSARTLRIVPDRCMDLLWNGRELLVAGSDSRFVDHHLAPSTTVGLRFRSGALPVLLDLTAEALRDQRIPLAHFWGDRASRLVDALVGADAGKELGLLERALHEHPRATARPDRLIAALTTLLADVQEPEPRIARVAHTLGLSERQLLRRTQRAIGYGPKLLARILRLEAAQRALHHTPERSLAALAQELGYADQAHLSHDAAELFGTTPTRMRRVADTNVRFPQDACGTRPADSRA